MEWNKLKQYSNVRICKTHSIHMMLCTVNKAKRSLACCKLKSLIKIRAKEIGQNGIKVTSNDRWIVSKKDGQTCLMMF